MAARPASASSASQSTQEMSSGCEAKYSDEPLSSIDVTSLPASRFLHQGRLPFRDAAGRINVNLLRHSTGILTPDVPVEVRDKLSKWLRHAERWQAGQKISSLPCGATPAGPGLAPGSSHGVTEARRRVRHVEGASPTETTSASPPTAATSENVQELAHDKEAVEEKTAAAEKAAAAPAHSVPSLKRTARAAAGEATGSEATVEECTPAPAKKKRYVIPKKGSAADRRSSAADLEEDTAGGERISEAGTARGQLARRIWLALIDCGDIVGKRWTLRNVYDSLSATLALDVRAEDELVKELLQEYVNELEATYAGPRRRAVEKYGI